MRFTHSVIAGATCAALVTSLIQAPAFAAEEKTLATAATGESRAAERDADKATTSYYADGTINVAFKDEAQDAQLLTAEQAKTAANAPVKAQELQEKIAAQYKNKAATAGQVANNEAWGATFEAAGWVKYLAQLKNQQDGINGPVTCADAIAELCTSTKTFADLVKKETATAKELGLDGFKAKEKEATYTEMWLATDKDGKLVPVELLDSSQSASANGQIKTSFAPSADVDKTTQELIQKVSENNNKQDIEFTQVIEGFANKTEYDQAKSKWDDKHLASQDEALKAQARDWFRTRLWLINNEMLSLKDSDDAVKAGYYAAWQEILPNMKAALEIANKDINSGDFNLYLVRMAENQLRVFARSYLDNVSENGLAKEYDESVIATKMQGGLLGGAYAPAKLDEGGKYPSAATTIEDAIAGGKDSIKDEKGGISVANIIMIILAVLAVLGALAAAMPKPPAPAPAPAPR